MRTVDSATAETGNSVRDAAMNATRRVALFARGATVLVENLVDEIGDRAELRLDPFRVMLLWRQGAGDRAAYNAPMNPELRGHARDRANTKPMLTTELLEQFHFGFPVHNRPPDSIGVTLGCGIRRRPGQPSVNAVNAEASFWPTATRLRRISISMSLSDLATAPKTWRPPDAIGQFGTRRVGDHVSTHGGKSFVLACTGPLPWVNGWGP